MQHRINLGQTYKYDSIWFFYSFTYKQNRENYIKHFIGDSKRMRKYTKTKFKKHNKTRTKYNSSLKASIQFTKPMKIELSQLLQMILNVKVHSN